MNLEFSKSLKTVDDKYVISLRVPAKEVLGLREKIAAEMAKVAVVPGFRPGKVTTDVIKQKFNKEINVDLAADLAAHIALKAADALNIRAGFRPKVAASSMPTGMKAWVGAFDFTGDFSIEVESLVPPALDDVTSTFELSIQPPDIQSDVDEQIHHLRHDLVVRTPTADAATEKHEVVCSITVLDETTGLEEKDLRIERFPFSFDLKAHSMLSDALAQRLLGVVTGQTLSFSEGDYRFDIIIDAVHEKVLPTLDDEFAAKVGYKDMTDLRNQITQEWVQKNAMRVKNAAHSEVRRSLVAANPFPIPAAWTNENFQLMMNRLGKMSAALGLTEEALREEAEMFAASDYLLEILFEKNKEELALTEADTLNYAAEEVIDTAHTPEDFLAGVVGNGQYNQWLKSVQVKKTLDWLIVKNNKKEE